MNRGTKISGGILLGIIAIAFFYFLLSLVNEQRDVNKVGKAKTVNTHFIGQR